MNAVRSIAAVASCLLLAMGLMLSAAATAAVAGPAAGRASSPASAPATASATASATVAATGSAGKAAGARAIAPLAAAKPAYAATAVEPTVDEPDPALSFWKDQVHYPFPVRYATASDRQGTLWQVAYMDEYAGPPQQRDKARVLILIHGRGSNAGSWGQIMQIALRKGLRLIALDIPHYGKSIPGNVDKPLTRTLDDVRDVFHKIVVEQLKVNKAVYLGHSLGGQIVLGYALQHPEAVERLIAVATGGLEEFNPSPLYQRSFERDLVQWEEKWKNTGMLTHELMRAPFSIEADYFFDGDGRSPGYFFRDGIYPRYMTELRKKMIAGNRKEFNNYITSYIHEIYTAAIELQANDPGNLYRKLGQLKMPIFVAMGERDPFFPAKALSGNSDVKMDLIKPFFEVLSAAGNPPQVKIYAGVGHFVYTDAPELFSNDVLDIIDGIAVPGREDVGSYRVGFMRQIGLHKKWNLFLHDMISACYSKI
ncbi:hypothetical protein BH11PSE11_BH11PSE11_04510 [soil metagenome]